jgi:quercetin dioxygenase-like cupin family protein
MTVEENRIGLLLVALCVAAVAVARAEEERKMITIDPRTAKFITVPGMPSCATAAILRGDPRKGPAEVLLKVTSGRRVPWHWHTANEELLIISGTGVLDMRDGGALKFYPGAYASLPTHHVHQARCQKTCMFSSAADAAFDIHYIDAAGGEISMEEALKPRAPRKAAKKK